MGELRVENPVKSYQRKEGWNTTRTLRVFDNVSFAVHEGEFVCIIGPSGCGKSTLLNLSAGLDQASGGAVYVDGRKVSGPGLDRGVVFQEFALMPWLTVAGNIEFGLRSKGMPAAERHAQVQRHIDLVGLSGFETLLPLSALRRHAPTRGHCTGVGDRALCAADGRALRGARCADA